MTRRGDDGFILDWPSRDGEDQRKVHSSVATRLRWTEARPTSAETAESPLESSVVEAADVDSGRRQFRVRLRSRPAPIAGDLAEDTPDEVVRLRAIVAELRTEVEELRHRVKRLGGTV